MPYALDVVFGEKGDAAVRRIWRALSEAGVPSALDAAGGHPHLTLGVATSVDEQALRTALRNATQTRPPRGLVLGSAGSFPGPGGIVFLGGVPTPELLAWHEAIHAAFKTSARDVRPYYAPKAWIPHVTLTYQLSDADIGRAIDVARRGGLPLVADFSAFALMETTPNAVRELWRVAMA